VSEPKRYAIRGFSAALVEEDNGVFVRYEDYASLKAEVERLERLVNYWKIEANCDHDRWLRVLADLDDLRRSMK
jgi:hypothetical protein